MGYKLIHSVAHAHILRTQASHSLVNLSQGVPEHSIGKNRIGKGKFRIDIFYGCLASHFSEVIDLQVKVEMR